MEQPCLPFGWFNRRLTAGGAFEGFAPCAPMRTGKSLVHPGRMAGDGWSGRGRAPTGHALMTRQIAGSGT